MKINNWVVILLVFIGVSVFTISLYMASLSGVMSKMGLVGGDFGQSIKVNELARQIMIQDQNVDCGAWRVAKRIPQYLISRGTERVKLSGELGGERIVCGVKLVQNKNVERGVYTIIKGLYYLKSHYVEMRILVQKDSSQCKLLTDPDYERWVESYLVSTEGRVHEVVLDVYKQVEGVRGGVEELCLD